jgi:NlpC/P60 family putative phage cell wall peptidase
MSDLSSSPQGPSRPAKARAPQGEGQMEFPPAEVRALASFEASLLQDRIIKSARTWLGTPYLHQASLKSVGCDCLGLVRGVWRDVYGAEPEMPPAYSSDWAEASSLETMVDAARRHCLDIPYTDGSPGDLVLFRWRDHLPAKHAGILSGADTMIHAQEGACVSDIYLSPWWRKRMAYVFRFPALLPSPLCGEGPGVGTTVTNLTRGPQPLPAKRGGEQSSQVI